MSATDEDPTPGVDAQVLANALDGMCVGLILTDPNLNVSWTNRSARRMLGFEGDVTGKRLGAVLRDPQMAEFWHQASAAEEAVLGEVALHFPESRELKVNASACRGADGALLGRALLFCDVTAERTVQIQMSRQASTRLMEIAEGWQNTATATPHAGLTQQELRVLRLVGAGLQNDEIAARIHAAPSTVRTHLKHAYAKLSLSSRSEAVRYAIEHGLV